MTHGNLLANFLHGDLLLANAVGCKGRGPTISKPTFGPILGPVTDNEVEHQILVVPVEGIGAVGGHEPLYHLRGFPAPIHKVADAQDGFTRVYPTHKALQRLELTGNISDD